MSTVAGSVRPARWIARPARDLSLESWQREWNALNDAAGAVPILACEIIVAGLETFGTGRELLLVGTRDELVVAMAVVVQTSRLHWSTFQPSQLPLGALVVAHGEDLSALGADLMRSALRGAMVVSFTQVDPRFVARGTEGKATRHDDYVDTAWVEIDGDFESYWAARGKNLRQNLRKQRNRLAADGSAVELRTWRDRADVLAALGRYGEMESSGWKAAGGTAIHNENKQGHFYRALFAQAADRGQALVHEYVISGRTVALNLCIGQARTLVILKTTYDESLKPLSPAFLLHEDQLREIFTAHTYERVEYYGRVMEWHTRWTDHRRTLFHTTVFRWPWLKRLAQWRRRSASTPEPVASASEPAG
jgi:CelD/BcsL family acetyltransferase involved in cellulose biosynthesis